MILRKAFELIFLVLAVNMPFLFLLGPFADYHYPGEHPELRSNIENIMRHRYRTPPNDSHNTGCFVYSDASGFTAYSEGNFGCAIVLWTYYERRGDLDAKFMLGIMQLNGKGFKDQEFFGAIRLRDAAVQGHEWAQNVLAMLFLKGRVVRQSDVDGLMWLTILASSRDKKLAAWAKHKKLNYVEKPYSIWSRVPSYSVAIADRAAESCLRFRTIDSCWLVDR